MQDRGAQLQLYSLNLAEIARRLIFATLSGGLLLLLLLSLGQEDIPPTPGGFLNLIGAGLLSMAALWGVWLAGDALFKLWRGARVIVYDCGIALQTRRGERFWYWEELGAVKGRPVEMRQGGITVLVNGAYTVYTCDGDLAFTVDYLLRQPEALARLVITRISAHLVPRCIQQVRGGATLEFGEFLLNRTGFGTQHERVAWHEMSAMGWQRDYQILQIFRRQQQPKSWAVGDEVANIAVMLRLIDQGIHGQFAL
ncbi:MAG: DUF6585 family protein [bacterium]|nr:DUF6585 family protein [bacterium]